MLHPEAMSSIGVVHRQQNGKARFTGPAFHFDGPVMLIDERLRDSQSDTVSAFATRYQWKKDLVHKFSRNAGSVVDNAY